MTPVLLEIGRRGGLEKSRHFSALELPHHVANIRVEQIERSQASVRSTPAASTSTRVWWISGKTDGVWCNAPARVLINVSEGIAISPCLGQILTKEVNMLNRVNNAILRMFVLYKDEEGQALAEYGLILGLIAVVAIAALTLLGTKITGKLTSINTALGGSSST
jgi:pilus assembly protein Flp/PilA